MKCPYCKANVEMLLFSDNGKESFHWCTECMNEIQFSNSNKYYRAYDQHGRCHREGTC